MRQNAAIKGLLELEEVNLTPEVRRRPRRRPPADEAPRESASSVGDEIDAMAVCANAMERLDPATRRRVARWVAERFGSD